MQSSPALGTKRQLPVTVYQADILTCSARPDTTDAYHLFFTLRWGVRVKPSVNRRQLKRAFERLVRRHDSLRLRFLPAQDGWGAEVQDDHPTGLQEIDLRDKTKEDQDSAIQSLGQTPIRGHLDPCFQMHLVDCGPEGHVIILSGHHTIVDGYAMIILVEDLLKLIFHMPLSDTALTHAAYVRDIDRQTKEGASNKQAYWQNMLDPLPADPNIGRTAQGLVAFEPHMVDRSIRLDGLLTPEVMTAVTRIQTQRDVSLFTLLYAAFADALCRMGQQDDVMICSWTGRQDAILRNFVGCDQRMMQHIYHRTNAPLVDHASIVSQKIYDGMQNLPSLYFAPDSPFVADLASKQRSLWRFQVHNSTPSARLTNSPFSKLLWKGMSGSLSFGPLHIEKLNFPKACETRFELTLLMNQTDATQDASLIASDSAFKPSELEQIKTLMTERLLT